MKRRKPGSIRFRKPAILMKAHSTSACELVAWMVFLCPVVTAWGDDDATPPPPSLPVERSIDPDATQDLVLLLDSPIFLRVQLEIDGKPFRQHWREHVASLHAAADGDGDQSLTAAEVASVLGSAEASVEVRKVLQDNSLWDFDLLPVDQRLSVEELILAAESRFGGAFQPASTNPAVATNGVDLTFVDSSVRAPGEVLFETLDADRDGKLTSGEVEIGRESLHRIDFDVDGNASLSEIEYTRNPFQGQTQFGPTGEAVPVLIIDRSRPLSAMIDQFLQRYGDAPEVSRGQRRVPRAEIGAPDDVISHYDRDGDSFLDFREVRALFEDPPAAIVLKVRVGARQPEQATVEVIETAPWTGIVMRTSPAGMASMLVEGNQIEVLTGQSTATQFAQYFQSLFMAYDRDANAYLEQSEVQGGQLDSVFTQFDVNHDGMLYAEEMLAVVEAESTSALSRSRLESSNRGRDFFQILDENLDRRINPRELEGILAHIGIWDDNDDQAISEREIPQLYQLTFDRGQPEFSSVFQYGGFAVSAAPGVVTQAAPVVTQGPMWFQRMDRNDDGDVSRREFLGTPEQFSELDADGDELISALEAAALADRPSQ
jgi:Ca2+-binding EF-hand superfamily protein